MYVTLFEASLKPFTATPNREEQGACREIKNMDLLDFMDILDFIDLVPWDLQVALLKMFFLS